MVKRYRTMKDALDPARPIPEPTTFVGGRRGGKFVVSMAGRLASRAMIARKAASSKVFY